MSPRTSPPASVGAFILAALTLVIGLAYWDEERESAAALADFAAEQATVAASLAAGLSSRFAAADAAHPADARDLDHASALATLSSSLAHLPRSGETLALLQAPGSNDFLAPDGRKVTLERLASALAEGRTSVRIERDEAPALGLPRRTAYAGLATVDAGALGRYGVAAISTARRERDRAIRAAWRLVLTAIVASALLFAFGWVSLRHQRRELVLQREVAVLAVQAERDERLARAARAAVMGTFAMGIAHEVSTPLGVILGRAEQLEARVRADPRASHAARIIMEQAERLKLLVRSFLDLARGGQPAFARVDSAAVVRGALSLVDHRFRTGGVALTSSVPAHLPVIQCDRALIEHALVNLVLNAREACKEGSTVDVTARADGQRVAFVVTDDGAGIRKEDAARVTEAFFTTKPVGVGTGLGLAIASEIVKSHGGTFTIEARAPHGTRACIELPTSPEEVRDAA